MDYFRNRYKNVKFVVSSDDQKWCQNNLQGKDVHFINRHLPQDVDPSFSIAADFAILAQCHHSIISYGLFGFWSAYLKPTGITLYYTDSYYLDLKTLNDENSKWIPWIDPCIEKINATWKFKYGQKDCVK